jgi:AraC-like DNA-binding protein
MRSREINPCPALRPYVRLIWLLEIEEPIEFGPPERVTPDGLVELVFHYRTPVSCRYEGEKFARQYRSAAVSQTRRYLEFCPEAATGLISVRFQPWGAYHFFRAPVAEFADRQFPCEALWGQSALEIEEKLAEAADDEARIALIENFLLAQLAYHSKPDIEPLVRAIWNRKGQISVPGLCREIGVGQRTLQRVFARALGTSPKRFTRLSRFLHACNLLRSGGVENLAEAGLVCGYYDQSHFISDFRSYAGMTPRQFLMRENVSFLKTG